MVSVLHCYCNHVILHFYWSKDVKSLEENSNAFKVVVRKVVGVVIAEEDFTAREDDELSLTKGTAVNGRAPMNLLLILFWVVL